MIGDKEYADGSDLRWILGEPTELKLKSRDGDGGCVDARGLGAEGCVSEALSDRVGEVLFETGPKFKSSCANTPRYNT